MTAELKVSHNSIIRKVSVNYYSYQYGNFINSVRSIFDLSPETALVFTYLDSVQDVISLSTAAEFHDLLVEVKASKNDRATLTIQVRPTSEEINEESVLTNLKAALVVNPSFGMRVGQVLNDSFGRTDTFGGRGGRGREGGHHHSPSHQERMRGGGRGGRGREHRRGEGRGSREMKGNGEVETEEETEGGTEDLVTEGEGSNNEEGESGESHAHNQNSHHHSNPENLGRPSHGHNFAPSYAGSYHTYYVLPSPHHHHHRSQDYGHLNYYQAYHYPGSFHPQHPPPPFEMEEEHHDTHHHHPSGRRGGGHGFGGFYGPGAGRGGFQST